MTKSEYKELLIKKGYDGSFPAVATPEDKDVMLSGFIKCVYRGPVSGKQCVVGILIPPEKYQESFEGSGVTTKDVENAISFPENVTVNQLRVMQLEHDRMACGEWNGQEWEKFVKQVLGE